MEVIETLSAFYPEITGPSISSLELAKNLRKGINTSFFCYGKETKKYNIGDFHVNSFKTGITQYGISTEIKKSIESSLFDIAKINNYRQFLADWTFIQAKAKKKPVIFEPRGALNGYKYSKKAQILGAHQIYDYITLKTVAKKSDVTVVKSDVEFEEAMEFGIAKEKIRKIPIGAKILDNKREKSNKIRLLFFGRITRRRPVEEIINALEKLNREFDNLTLTIVGPEVRIISTEPPGYLSELKTISKKKKIGNVYFKGQANHQQIGKIYADADIFIYPTEYENFGAPIAEAAAAGLPIVCSKTGIAPEIIKEGKTGFFAENSGEIYEKIRRLLLDKRLRRSMGRALQAIAKKKFSWKKIGSEYSELYEQLSRR